MPLHSTEQCREACKTRIWIIQDEQWRNYITSDEAMFYVQHVNGKRDIQYLKKEEKRSTAVPFEHKAHPKGIMVLVGMSANRVTKPIFVEPGAKINRTYYINNVLKKFQKCAKKLYPLGNYKFHQDSAPSHTAKDTLAWLIEQGIDFIKPDEWMPNSPDAAPCDYFLCGYLKSKVNKRNIETINQLKYAIRIELRNIPQELLDNALRSWPTRCLQIHEVSGGHIEKFR